METHDEWQITERRYFSEGSMAAIKAPRAAGDPRGEAGLARLLANPDDHPHALRFTRPDLHHSVGHGPWCIAPRSWSSQLRQSPD